MALSKITTESLLDGEITAAKFATGVGGKVLQVITATDSTARTTTSSSYVTASNTVSADITLATTSSKVLVIASLAVGQATNNSSCYYTLKRESTELAGAGGFFTVYHNIASTSTVVRGSGHISTLDSPSTAGSALTYQLYIKTNGVGTAHLNNASEESSITLLEISG